jgi:hypothetical protein
VRELGVANEIGCPWRRVRLRLMRIGLVGCAKSKVGRPAAARDHYTSALFRGRRSFVESGCDRWFILSAEHGLVEPTQQLAPYDTTLTKASDAQRRAWSQRVLDALQDRLGISMGSCSRPTPGRRISIRAWSMGSGSSARRSRYPRAG